MEKNVHVFHAHNKDCNVSTSTSKFEISWDTLQLAQWQIEELNICILYPIAYPNKNSYCYCKLQQR
jgi:hypothetical protein